MLLVLILIHYGYGLIFQHKGVADSSEVKIDVLIKDYCIGEAKFWMITISDHRKGIPDPMKKELFERFYSNVGIGSNSVIMVVPNEHWINLAVYILMKLTRKNHIQLMRSIMLLKAMALSN
jgi:hypothetical protein